jgi:hypothetical protein
MIAQCLSVEMKLAGRAWPFNDNSGNGPRGGVRQPARPLNLAFAPMRAYNFALIGEYLLCSCDKLRRCIEDILYKIF